MSTETLLPVGHLQASQDTIRLHFAAQRVLEAAHHGGRGGFRVDDAPLDVLERVPRYIEQYAGDWFPKAYYDEAGNIQSGGASRVAPQDTSFEVQETWIDQDSGETRAWLKWRPLEETDPDAAKIDKSPKAAKKLFAALLGSALMVEAYAFGLMLDGSQDASEAIRNHAPQEVVDAAHNEAEQGAEILGLMPIVGGVVVAAVGIHEIRHPKPQ